MREQAVALANGRATRRRGSLRLGTSARRTLHYAFVYICVTFGAAILLVPLVWLVSTSFKQPGLIFVVPPQWIPNPVRWQNYSDVLRVLPFGLFARNTISITFFSLLGTLISASAVAYGFARVRFPFRDIWFLVLLGTMMIPGQVTLIPTYILFRMLGWLDTFLPLIIPAFLGGGAFNIFLLRQFYMTLPLELDDAARIDGCNDFQIFRRIVLPQARPALGVVAIFGFIDHWNAFFGPLIYLNSMEKYTLALGVNLLKGMKYQATEWHLLMAASVMTALPCILLYFIAQRYFIQGIVFTGVKG